MDSTAKKPSLTLALQRDAPCNGLLTFTALCPYPDPFLKGLGNQ